jgi:hypothetical protein
MTVCGLVAAPPVVGNTEATKRMSVGEKSHFMSRNGSLTPRTG